MTTKKENIDEGFEEYNAIISEMDVSTIKYVFSRLPTNKPELFKVLLHSFVAKLVLLSNDSSNELINNLDMVLEAVKRIPNSVSILFYLLENLSAKKLEIYRISVLELLSKQEYNVMNIVNLLYKNDSEILIFDILKNQNDKIDDFIRESIKIDHSCVSKNISLIFPLLNPIHFVNYKSFTFFFEKENHYLRNCFIDIIESLILYFKEQNNLESIKELTNLLSYRLSDVNYYVRNKALGSISNLFRNEAILKDQRNHLIKEIIERAKDKTVIVRKKSINLLSQILMNHPFKDRDFLDREFNVSLPSVRFQEDFNEFVNLMEEGLTVITSLLDYNLKTDINEITTFIKIAYLLKLKNSKQAIQKTLKIVFTKERLIIIEVFKEILTQRGEILYEFINDKAFEIILSNLDVDEKPLFKNIYNNHKVSESIYVLKQMRKPITENNALSLLQFITQILFTSQNEVELKANVKCYLNTLYLIRNMKYRIEHNHEIFNLITKNIIKMVFFEKSMIKYTIELIYYLSNNPEKTIGKFVKNLCLSKSTLKILDSIGFIALNQFYLLEIFEKKFRRLEADIKRVSISGNIEYELREKRKSLEDVRRSSLSRLSIDRNTSSFEIAKLSLKFDELEENLKNKPDEEVADFFFFLKEKEILYSETSLLHQLIPLLKQSIHNADKNIQLTAYSSLFRCMLISSEFFEENLPELYTALDHANVAIKNVACVALHDFIIFYNSSINTDILFEKLDDMDVAKNVILIIFNLLQKNIIRIKNNSVKVVGLLFNETLGNIVKTMIKTLAGCTNVISLIFYEVYLSNLGPDYIKYLASFINLSIQESMFLKCLKSDVSFDKLQVVYESFELSEKFVKENMFRGQMQQLISNK